jgi:hypothetical protein
LEDRKLLSTAVAPAAEVSALAKPRSVHVVGSIAGGEFLVQSRQIMLGYIGSGTLEILGTVQMRVNFTASIPPLPRTTLTLTSTSGALTFVDKATYPGLGLNRLTLQQGTGAYAGWTGTGRLIIKLKPGFGHVLATTNSFNLTLRV